MSERELKAGRELDLRIAREVLGLKVYTWQQYQNSRRDLDPCIIKSADGLSINRKGGPHGTGWSPSEYIGDAWEVVEKMRAAGWTVRVQEMPDGLPYLAGSGWRPEENRPIRRRAACWLYPSPELVAKMVGSYLNTVCEFADAAPLAICRAALKAIEQTEKATA